MQQQVIAELSYPLGLQRFDDGEAAYRSAARARESALAFQDIVGYRAFHGQAIPGFS
jgi:hypothetical protein